MEINAVEKENFDLMVKLDESHKLIKSLKEENEKQSQEFFNCKIFHTNQVNSLFIEIETLKSTLNQTNQ